MNSTIREFSDIFSDYQPTADVYDEAWDGARLRAPYAQLVSQLDGLGRFEFSRRWTQARRIVRENGIAYSGHTGDQAPPRLWTLDPLPVLIQAIEWQTISAAIAQRAKLLNLLLCDLYGPQKLIQDRTLPASLLYSDPNFFRSCIGITLGQETSNDYLHLYAADIARSPDGGWWVLADRTEAPFGLGYALEHRIVMSRMLPKPFRQSNSRRLASFFTTLQDRLRSLAPYNRDNPRIVLLSDGPTNPYHTEDAYLSRYLGYTLVEDGDLTVRNRATMLKTLGGLLPVDVVLRHQNSIDCDPLEHNNSSGVAGLTHSIRSDRVAVANQIGSGLVGSAAYMAFSARLSERLLGEDLILPNVATWWCGEPKSLKFVLANLDSLTIQPAFRNRGRDEALRKELKSMRKSALADRIRSRPNDFVAQEIVQRSSTPVWRNRLRSHRLAIRTYGVSKAESDDFCVMAGGLGRVTRTLESLELSIRKGETCKDVWILSDSPVEPTALSNTLSKQTVRRRAGSKLPSRVADNLFWLGRRLERTEFHTRLLGLTAKRLIGEFAFDEIKEMPLLLRCLATAGLIEPGYALSDLRQTLPDVSLQLPGLMFSSSPISFSSGVKDLVRLGRLVRDRLNLPAIRIIQQLEATRAQRAKRLVSLADVCDVTDELQTLLAAFSGIVVENMTRTQVFQFLDLGRRLERSYQTLNLLNHCIGKGTTAGRSELEAVLELMDSRMTYRSRYMANVHVVGVMDLIITDETNPRSLAFQMIRVKAHVDQLPREEQSPTLTPEQKAVISLLNEIQVMNVENVMLEEIGRQLLQWETEIEALSNSISHHYLVHAKVQRLSGIGEA